MNTWKKWSLFESPFFDKKVQFNLRLSTVLHCNNSYS